MYINIVSTQFNFDKIPFLRCNVAIEEGIVLSRMTLCRPIVNKPLQDSLFSASKIKENCEPFWNDQMLLVFRFETHVWLSVLIVICCTQED